MEPLLICILSSMTTLLLQQVPLLQIHAVARRFLAAAILGAPAALVSWNEGIPGFSLTDPVPSLLIMVPFVFLAMAFTWVLSTRTDHTKQYPELSTGAWTPRLFFLSALSWIAYDVAYEFLFRGYLLLTLSATAGSVPAVLIVVTLYTLVHITRSRAEMLLCIPFGVLLCMITLTTGNIWAVVFIHISLSISNEYFVIRANGGWSGDQKAINQLS